MILNEHLQGTVLLVDAKIPHDYQFILNIQATSEMGGICKAFFNEITYRLHEKPRQITLIYHVGILFESLEILDNEIIHKQLTAYPFSDSRKDFNCEIKEHKIIVFKRAENDLIQLELELEQERESKQGKKQDALQTGELLAPAHVFINHVFQQLRIENFEYRSVKDDITMAYNQNYLKAFMQNEIERSRRYASKFSIIFFDLDNLKAINDEHGHLIGTEILKEVAEVLRSQIRKVDILSRFGGDEFVIVLVHAESSKAYEVGIRIKEAVKNHDFLKSHRLNIKITGCLGISSFPTNGNTVEELIRKADIAMYEVKRAGKNGIKIYEGDQ